MHVINKQRGHSLTRCEIVWGSLVRPFHDLLRSCGILTMLISRSNEEFGPRLVCQYITLMALVDVPRIRINHKPRGGDFHFFPVTLSISLCHLCTGYILKLWYNQSLQCFNEKSIDPSFKITFFFAFYFFSKEQSLLTVQFSRDLFWYKVNKFHEYI